MQETYNQRQLKIYNFNLRFFLEWTYKKLGHIQDDILKGDGFEDLESKDDKRYAYGYLKMLDGMVEVMEIDKDDEETLFKLAKNNIEQNVDWRKLYKYS